jgi:flagellar biosynthesis protein FlhB
MPEQSGEKTEQATPRRLEEAVRRGQIARSAEVQSALVLLAGLVAFKMMGAETWRGITASAAAILGHLHELPITADALPGYAIRAALAFARSVGPVILATAVGGLLAGGLQNRFQTTSEALSANWARLNPVEGFTRLFSTQAMASLAATGLKLGVIGLLSYSEIKRVLTDPALYSVTNVAGTARFLAEASGAVAWRVVLALAAVAVLDYTYQFWHTTHELMMTRQEVKDELKNTDGDPQIKARQRRRRTKTIRQMLAEVPKADVVITNPTHLAIALRYQRSTMKAPQIVAKGSRLNAQRIREIAQQSQVPIIENKPLARVMFKYGRVGGEIPAQLYVAVAEVLAYVYRTNRYRYYALDNQVAGNQQPGAQAPG